MDGVFEIVEPGGRFTYEFEAQPAGIHALPLPRDAAEEAHPQGPLRRVHHRPEEAATPANELVMVMNGFDTDGDGENNFYTVNGRSFYYARYPIRVKRSELVRIYLANLTEFDLHQLLPPARGLLPLPADRHGRQLGVHGHRHAVPGAARRDRDRVRRHRPAHVPRPPVRVRRARLDGVLRRGRREVEAGSADDALRPCQLAGVGGRAGRCCSRSPSASVVTTGSSLVDLVGSNPPPADRFDIRRVEFSPGEIRIVVRNPQRDDLTIASVTVDDAIVPFTSTARRHSDGCARRRSSSRSSGSRTTRSRSA